ncbi:hypothetical protein GAR05_06162 [Micromonospora saelicesensis]|uniref:PASTA domain-containing protein n=1 Tax=Micromonospora saelicesensis TaxID=285676 RepID=A0ABX9CB16_9ACTN|nr:hypothetical protein [Micromonospora saelicesensis]RAN92670.1 hypothetical protein GAR05_06162 [Micromonospora saelicesensis]
MTATPGTPADPTRPESGPFTAGRVYTGAWQIPMDQAVASATAAGFRVTPRSNHRRVFVERGPWTAATISPTPAGVVVKRSMTLAHTAIVGAVIVLLIVCVGINGRP